MHPRCILASGDPTPINTVTSSSNSSSLYTSIVQSGPPLLVQHSRPTLAFKPFISLFPTSYFLPLHPHYLLVLMAVSVHLLHPLPLDSITALQWNAGGLRARSTELPHFISSHSVDLICIQESNLNSSSSFQIPGFSAL